MPVEVGAAGVEIPDVTLKTQPKSLAVVNVEAKRPLIEQRADRTIVNVEASPSNAGATAMEVLERSPNISVDNNGNISLKGKQGVIIMMDGKQTYLSPSDLANVLKNMPASSLDQIEIMTNPSAKYDASGNSGIINIKTKKNKTAGSNGNISVGHTTGFFDNNGKEDLTWKPSFTLNYNNRKNKVNLFTNFVYNHREGRGALELTQRYYREGKQIDSINAVNTYFKFRNNNFTFKVGADYYADKKNIFGVVFNSFLFFGRPRPTTYTTFADLNGKVFSRIDTKVYNELNFGNYGVNFNFKHTFDSTGREFTTDVDYTYYSNVSEQMLSTGFFNGTYQKTSDSLYLKGHLPSEINIYALKSDYVHPLKKGARIEAGIKSSYVKTDNLVNYLRGFRNVWSPDSRIINFIFDENINAAYLTLSKQIKKWNLQSGLSVENTNSKGFQEANNSVVTKHYTNLFPSAFVSYAADKKNQFTASFSRRVQRPNYQDLNPFTFFLDSLSFRQGNPYLGPQFSYNYELAHTFKSKLTTTLNYSSTDHVISQIIRQQRGNSNEIISVLTVDNIAKLYNKGIAISSPVKVAKWWNINFSGNVYNNHYIGTFITTENNVSKVNDIDLKYSSFSVNFTNTFTLKNSWLIEVLGFYNHKSLQGLFLADPIGQVSFGLAKNNLMKGKGTLRVNVRDPFALQKFKGIQKYANIDQTVYNTFDTHNVGFTFSYRFGKGQNAQRKRGGSQEEQSRVGQAQ
jgi:outer membrane receptor protein involved in Fe transport